ncbi:hypothetical protein CAEBREN_15608 [Caenorhabditis brenneri]|uniref:Uncharacterized protein n=1 Tax=Caenorhabditis brenneri TaxID=135651 RepID=G0NPA8_CAEBE|nr:hypothetical protein CAEBREN_15608 [Caenorhabditis brenneri]
MNNTTSSWISDNARGLEKFRIFLKTVTTIFLLLSVVMIITMIFTADEVYESDMESREGMGAQGQWENRESVDLDEEEEESEDSDDIKDEEDQEDGQILGSDGGDKTDYGTDVSSNE